MFEVVEYIGIVAFAISGFLVGVRNRLDLLGVLISVFLTALGGGVIRDILVDKTPYSFTHYAPIIFVILVILFMLIFKLYRQNKLEKRLFFIISDSLGLASFSISGAIAALESNFNITGVLAISFIASVGGGIVRDIIINEVPLVFKTGFYGTISLLIGVVIYILNYFKYINISSLILILTLGTLLRVYAYYKKWSLPRID